MRAQARLAVLVAALGGCGTAHGGTPTWRRAVLVELFTSQGCSSCPRADAFVRDLPALGLGRQRVVPLTFHVDYWDNLGWKDRFARPEFTARQEWYARATRLRSADGDSGLAGLYTPQMVIDGQVHLSGGRRQEAQREMERAGDRPALFQLEPEVALHGPSVDVAVAVSEGPEARRDLDWRVRVALAARATRTDVSRGENAGETLTEAAVVRALSSPMALPGERGAKVRVRLTKPDDVDASNLEIVVFVQSQQTGAVGAAIEATGGAR
ncbi:MAG TPA: DUF1223 domain-containing protein [Polyangia bacterium]|nr:DUF1223 domain-containing protein [Polyangia bacterium]